MITINGTAYAWDDWQVLATAAALAVTVLLLLTLRAAGRAARDTGPLRNDIGWLAQRVQALGDGQERLSGGLAHVTEAQTQAQHAMLQLMEARDRKSVV